MARKSIGTLILLLAFLGMAAPAVSQITTGTTAYDPYGCPRPGAGHKNVPLRTSIYVEMRAPGSASVNPSSVTLRLKPSGGSWIDVLSTDKQFAPGCSGRFATVNHAGVNYLAVYADRPTDLLPKTLYTLRLTATGTDGSQFRNGYTEWTFTTEDAAATHSVSFNLDASSSNTIQWKGGFFSGFNKTGFCVSHSNNWIPTYDLMDEIRKEFPRSWDIQRDAHILASDYRKCGWWINAPNAVAEVETRRIKSMTPKPDGVELEVEAIVGNDQYGMDWNRPISGDFKPGYTVLIADTNLSTQVQVVSVDDAARTVLVKPFPTAGWNLDYESVVSTEDPQAPGLYARGGCYLYRFSPVGSLRYYWDRIDKEYDLTQGTYGRRLIVNYRQSPGDLSIDGKEDSPPKDYVQMHEAIYQVTSHTLSRYGAESLNFTWSVLNEPDLSPYWRFNWPELQKFYDYATDAILRAFEDNNYDSDKVFIGGLELGAISGTNLRVHEFLAHCSPSSATIGTAVKSNFAYSDPRLDGKRSRRVENLCRANAGRGAPCDFIVIHAYNGAKMAADKFITAKQVALQIDPVYYRDLWINSHESCPGWAPPPDQAAYDSFLGNGYFSTWCADVSRRLVAKAQLDSRYSHGESIITFWAWIMANFTGLNAGTQVLDIDDDGDGKKDRSETVALPILYFLGMLNGMGSDYVALPEQTVGGHVVSGFMGRTGRDLRILLYSHDERDTQSRSAADFEVTLNLAGMPWTGSAFVKQYQFDADHSSAFRLIESFRSRANPSLFSPQDLQQVREATKPHASEAGEMQIGSNSSLQLRVPVSGNGANYVVLSPDSALSSSMEWAEYR